MIFGHKGHLNTRNKFPKEGFPNPKIFLPILVELRNLGFGERGEIHKIKGAKAKDSFQGYR
jgi:hypothetical protein